MDNQQRVNRRRRRNLPAELKVEIVDCFPVENAAHFLANVPNRLIIHHCAPRIRRILKMIPQIAADYARTLPAPIFHGQISLMNRHKYTPEMGIFLRHGAAHCRTFWISSGTINGFFGYPANFFDDLIKFYYETKVPTKALRHVYIGFPTTNLVRFPTTNPVPWPAALVQPQMGEMDLEESEVYNAWVEYILRNKHNPGIVFKLWIFFDGGGKCYEQMTCFDITKFGIGLM